MARPKMEEEKKRCNRFQLRLTNEQLQMLEEAAKRDNISKSEVIVRALDYYVKFHN